MPQNLLPFKYQGEKKSQKIIRYGGLLPILEFSKHMGLYRFADEKLAIRSDGQGWLDSQILQACFLLNICGGDSVSDIDRLEIDEGLCRVLGHCEGRLLGRSKTFIGSRFRRGRERRFPSDNAIHNYMDHFHDESEEIRREQVREGSQKAFIPVSNQYLKTLSSFMRNQCHFAQQNRPVSSVTLDVDGTVKESRKRSAFYTYKKEKGYQPLNGYWYEQDLLVHSQFRDGNVNTGFGVLDFVKESFSHIPPSIKKRFFRMDSAGYIYEVMDYCESEGIGFSISVPLCAGLKADIKRLRDEEWKDLPFSREQLLKGRKSEESLEESFWQWQDVVYIPDDPRGEKYRYVVVRSRIPDQDELFDGLPECCDEEEKKKTYHKDGKKYRVRVIATNQHHLDGVELFHWHNKRCGYSEQIHSIMKTDFAGGQLPSNKFGVNAFWWIMMIISLNIMSLYKRFVLGKQWWRRRMKSIRFYFIYLAGRVEFKAGQLIINIKESDLLTEFRRKARCLKWVPI
ncbi:MAG: IS1380 family transposase [Candidatus Aminicenantes bacterium]|nr:IS1380 family transposase [Candidatus Aminicenantes bacterium]